MREVSHVMPEGSWLQATDASVTGDPNATTAPAGVVAAPTGPYASFVGCTPHQSDVAQLMVRLRDLHRVEDVQLNESAQESLDGEATVDNCGTLYKFDVAVTFSPTPAAGEAPRDSGASRPRWEAGHDAHRSRPEGPHLRRAGARDPGLLAAPAVAPARGGRPGRRGGRRPSRSAVTRRRPSSTRLATPSRTSRPTTRRSFAWARRFRPPSTCRA